MKRRTAILVVSLCFALVAAPATAERRPDVLETGLDPVQVDQHHLVSLMVDPASGNILLPPPGRDTINDLFEPVSATCVDCAGQPGGGCPPTTKTVRVELRATTDIPAGWNVSDLALTMTTLVSVDYSESAKDPSVALVTDDLVTVDINTDVSNCDHWFKVFFDMCDATPGSPTDACPAGGFEFQTSQVIDGATVTCSSVTTNASYTECRDLLADGRYMPNGITCGPVWSTTNSSYSDTQGFCESLTGSTTFEVYYACTTTTLRSTWFNHVWSTYSDNGYTQHVRCYY